jgi:tRNA dimethylallyltransferase
VDRQKIQYDLLVITGPTASGKTSLAAAVAARIGGEVISADSRQVYRGMDIGTGKDLDDYTVNGLVIPVHLIDIADPGYKYNVFEYQHDFLKVYEDMLKRGKFPVVCGGSGMYIDSIVSGYKLVEVPPDREMREELEKKPMEELTALLRSYKSLHNVTDVDTKKRVIRAIEIEKYYSSQGSNVTSFPKVKTLITAVNFDRDSRRKRISERLKERLGNGMVEEVRELMSRGITDEELIYYGLEYKYITFYLTGRLNYDEMFKTLETEIHRFAKRQMTWFRGMERKGIKIHWLDGCEPMEEKVERIRKLLSEVIT